MKCYTITYYAKGENGLFVGSGYGNTVDEAVEDFFSWHLDDVEDLVDIELYK